MPSEDTLLEVRRLYCVWDAEGQEDSDRVRRAAEALEQAQRSKSKQPPEVSGVPRLRFRVERAAQIAEAVRKFLPEVEADPRRHAMSFVDPLRVANELGVAVSPAVARMIRRGLAGILSFDPRSLDDAGRLRGIGKVRWVPPKGAR